MQGFFGDVPLPWGLVGAGALIGAGLLVIDHFLPRREGAFRIYLMPTAVGLYLPLGMSAAIMLGGLAAALAERNSGDRAAVHHRGMLFASGLIAGESLLGVFLAGLAVAGLGGFSPGLSTPVLETLTWATLGAVVFSLVRTARRAAPDTGN